MSRPSIRRALKRAGMEPEARPPRRSGSRNLAVVPTPCIFLPGEEPDAGPVEFEAIFGRRAPVELEIGTGKGRFLLAEAAAHPDRNYLGAEIEGEYARMGRVLADRLSLANVKVERLDGKLFVMRRLPPESLDALHVYFPDPWPKKRHWKRRLFDAAFAAAAGRALRRGARLWTASDHPAYWAIIERTLATEETLERVSDAETGAWSPGTSYSLKFLQSGRPVFQAVFRRR